MAHLLEDNVFFCPCTHKPLQTYAFTFVLNPNFGPKTPTLSEWVYIVHTRIVHFQTSNTLTFTAYPYAVIVLAYRSGFLTKLWGGHRLGALGHSRLLSQERGGGFLFTMTLPSKWVSTTFEALFFFQVKRLKSGMENKYLNPFISLVTLHCTAVSIAKTKNVSMKTFTFPFKPEWIISSWMLETLYIVQRFHLFAHA